MWDSGVEGAFSAGYMGVGMDLMTLVHDDSQLIERDRVEICTVFMKMGLCCTALSSSIRYWHACAFAATQSSWSMVRCKIGAL